MLVSVSGKRFTPELPARQFEDRLPRAAKAGMRKNLQLHL